MRGFAACRREFHEHAVLGDVQLACRLEASLKRVVRHLEGDEVGRIEGEVFFSGAHTVSFLRVTIVHW